MLILLPPSESKRAAGRGRPLDLGRLSAPALTPLRMRLLAALQDLCRTDPARAIEVLGLGPTQFDLVVANAGLTEQPTAAAGRVYTGVLYAALGLDGLTGQELRRSNRRIAIVSALFGIVRTADRIPAYRLSGGCRVPGIGPLPKYWREAVTGEVARHRGLVVDMLSTPYAAMVALPRPAVTVKVWQAGPGGSRTAVSHFNKATKGELARLLATAPAEPRSPADALDVVRAGGWRAELDGSRLDVWMRD